MCTSYKLAEAIDILAFLNKGSQVTAVQFEDGSGYKFNYQLNHGEWKFIDFATTPLLAYWHAVNQHTRDNILAVVDRIKETN